jgi:hypothetical protein
LKHTTSPEDSNLFALDSFPTLRSGKQCVLIWCERRDLNPQSIKAQDFKS